MTRRVELLEDGFLGNVLLIVEIDTLKVLFLLRGSIHRTVLTLGLYLTECARENLSFISFCRATKNSHDGIISAFIRCYFRVIRDYEVRSEIQTRSTYKLQKSRFCR